MGELENKPVFSRTRTDSWKFFLRPNTGLPTTAFLCIIPHNKTILNAVLELLQYYHETLQRLQQLPSDAPNPYNGCVRPGSSGWQMLIDNYVTSLAYFLAARDLSSIHTDLENAVNTDCNGIVIDHWKFQK